MRRIFWAGDSTVKTNKFSSFPQSGIGQAFDRYTQTDVVIYNHAENGRSTKSFMDEGRLARIEEEIGEGDYLFIQFGHNDEKIHDPSRYTDPHGQFIENLGRFVTVAKSKGALPVFITSVERRHFDQEGRLKPSEHTEYIAGMKEAGEKYGVPVVDLFSMSREFLEKTGDADSVKYYMHLEKGEAPWAPDGQIDDTHLKYEGAVIYAGMVAKGVLSLGAPYDSLIDDQSFSDSRQKAEE